MIRHVVVWRLKDTTGNASRMENALEMKRQLESMKGKIPEIRTLEVGINLESSEDASDVVLIADFQNQADLAVYQKHPEHLKVIEFIRRVRTERRVIDFSVPG